jgi:Flp pilus assembly pilin Flp
MTNPDLDDMVVEGTSTRDEAETESLRKLWSQEEGRDIAEYAVMLAVILVLVVGTIRLIGGSANNVFSATASSIGGMTSKQFAPQDGCSRIRFSFPFGGSVCLLSLSF